MRTILATILTAGSCFWVAAVLEAAEPAAEQPAAAAQEKAEQRADQWRYKWHNNQWWYYTAQGQWLVYHDDAWQPYVAPPVRTYAAPSYRRRTSGGDINPAHSLGATGNYPRYWLWKRLGEN